MPRALLSLVAGLIALLVVAISGGDHGSPLWPFVGRFHPLLVHLPIGVLVLAVACDISTQWWRSAAHQLVSPLLLIGAWTAIASAMAGLVLADWGSYDPAVLAWHRRLGLAVPALASLGYWLHGRAMTARSSLRVPALVTSGLLLAAVVVGGHLGGSLTRGEGYLTRHLPEGVRRLVGLPGENDLTRIHVANPELTPVFDSLIHPVLTARCGACHNPERRKGGLILTTAKGLFAGGRQGKVVVPGRADDSEMIIRLSLPPGHTDAMPPDHAIPSAEIALIRWWIDQGASTEITLSAIERPTFIRRTLAAYGLDDLPQGILALPVETADSSAIVAARNSGLTVQTLGVKVGYLSVDAASVPAGWVAGTLSALRPLAANVASVNLSRTSAGDSALVTLGTMPRLTRLHLSSTRVTDAGLQSLTSLQYLEYLNLVDTNISDAGLRSLEQLPRLRALYVWGTHATPGGVARLRRALPRALIAIGAAPLVEPTTPVDTATPTGKAKGKPR